MQLEGARLTRARARSGRVDGAATGLDDQIVGVRRMLPIDRPTVRAFVRLEQKVMNRYPLVWSMPDADARKQLSGRSAFFHKMEHALFVAESEGQPVALRGEDQPCLAASQGADTTGPTNSV